MPEFCSPISRFTLDVHALFGAGCRFDVSPTNSCKIVTYKWAVAWQVEGKEGGLPSFNKARILLGGSVDVHFSPGLVWAWPLALVKKCPRELHEPGAWMQWCTQDQVLRYLQYAGLSLSGEHRHAQLGWKDGICFTSSRPAFWEAQALQRPVVWKATGYLLWAGPCRRNVDSI